MIESLTIAGPLALLRAQSAELNENKVPPAGRAESILPPDPTAPAGPRPSFESTPLEQIREAFRTKALRSAPEAFADSRRIVEPGPAGPARTTSSGLDRSI